MEGPPFFMPARPPPLLLDAGILRHGRRPHWSSPAASAAARSRTGRLCPRTFNLTPRRPQTGRFHPILAARSLALSSSSRVYICDLCLFFSDVFPSISLFIVGLH